MNDRRIFERFPVNFTMIFLDVGNGSEGVAKIQDISAKGIGIIADEGLLPKTSLELWLRIPGSEPLYTRGRIIWSRSDPSGSFYSGIHLEKATLMGFNSFANSFAKNLDKPIL